MELSSIRLNDYAKSKPDSSRWYSILIMHRQFPILDTVFTA